MAQMGSQIKGFVHRPVKEKTSLAPSRINEWSLSGASATLTLDQVQQQQQLVTLVWTQNLSEATQPDGKLTWLCMKSEWPQLDSRDNMLNNPQVFSRDLRIIAVTLEGMEESSTLATHLISECSTKRRAIQTLCKDITILRDAQGIARITWKPQWKPRDGLWGSYEANVRVKSGVSYTLLRVSGVHAWSVNEGQDPQNMYRDSCWWPVLKRDPFGKKSCRLREASVQKYALLLLYQTNLRMAVMSSIQAD